MSDIVERLRSPEVFIDTGGLHSPVAHEAADTIASLTADNKRLRAALKLARTGLNAGLFQYAARDFHGNIVPGDEQSPWIKAMQIGLDAVTAALPLPARQRTDLHEPGVSEEATDMSEDTQWMLDKKEVDRVIKANRAMYRRWLRDTQKEVARRLEEAFKKNRVRP